MHVPANTDNEVDFWLTSDVEVTVASCSPLQADLLPLLSLILLHVRLRALEDNLALGNGRLKVG